MKYQQLTKILITAALALLSPQLTAIEQGGAVPECALSSLAEASGKGANSMLSQYKGDVLYVDFWASWCGPCAKSFPFLNDLYQQLKGQGLHIVAVNLDENLEDAKAFLAKYPANFQVMADVSKQCAKDFDVKAMPSSYIIDRKGVVHHVQLGFKPGEAQDLQQMVEKLLREKPPG